MKVDNQEASCARPISSLIWPLERIHDKETKYQSSALTTYKGMSDIPGDP
jgi:hypothetical protein